MQRALIAVFVTLVGCGGETGGDDDGVTPDSPAGGNTVVEVTPCTGESATITADPSQGATQYTPPATTITQGQIVKFEMPAAHDVHPHPTQPSDPGIRVNFGETKCLRFTQTGTFTFFCLPHGFSGTVTVN